MEKDRKLNNQDLDAINGGVEKDNAYYRYVMGIKYKCNDCGHIWETATKPTECEECGSINIERN